MSVLSTIGSIAGGLISGIGDLFGWEGVSKFGQTLSGTTTSITNAQAQQAQLQGAKEQAELSRSIFDYQKNLQQTLFQREDNAVQRRVADLESAGLSKTLAAGSSANAGQPVSVSTPYSENYLKGQALQQGLVNMLSIAQSKAQVEKAQAEAKLANVEASEKEYNLNWYEKSGLPTGVKSGIMFLANTISQQLGVGSTEVANALLDGVNKILKKFGISTNSLSKVLAGVGAAEVVLDTKVSTGSKPSNSSVKRVSWAEVKDIQSMMYNMRGSFMSQGYSYDEADQMTNTFFSDFNDKFPNYQKFLDYEAQSRENRSMGNKAPYKSSSPINKSNGGKVW